MELVVASLSEHPRARAGGYRHRGPLWGGRRENPNEYTEKANPSKVAPSGGPLCVVRGGQEEATQKVAPSVETLIKLTESAEEANHVSPPTRAREETASTGEEAHDADDDVACF